MPANFRLSGSLKDVTGGQDQYTVESGHTIREILVSLGIEPLTVALVVVNKIHQNKDYVIQDGDEILVMSVVGGG
jgi:sulfur carrier protein ThiS